MSPFWKNVDEEIKYLNMNLKTLAKVSHNYERQKQREQHSRNGNRTENRRCPTQAFGLAFGNNEKSKFTCNFRRKIRCDSFIPKIPRHYFRYGRFSRPAEGIT